MSDLLPCRFCRFAPHAWLDDYINGRAVTDPDYIIECENGNCSVMPEVRGTYPYIDEVRALWNAANALPAVQPDREKVAFSMWKAEADRAAPNVGKNRIPSGFMVASDADREKWLGLADAAIRAMMGETP